MANLTYRVSTTPTLPGSTTAKGTPLTNAEVDANFKALADEVAGKGAGTVTAVSVASANGFTGSSSGGATPGLTLTTSVSGLLKGNGTAISAAVSGTDIKTINGTSVLGSGDIAAGSILSVTATGSIPSAGTVVQIRSDGTVEAVTGVNAAAGTLALLKASNTQPGYGGVSPDGNTVCVLFQDSGNANTLTCVAGTVSGTTITFGTPVVVVAGSGRSAQGVCFISNTQVCMGYGYAASWEANAIIGTISGNSITLGSAQTVSTTNGGNFPPLLRPLWDSTKSRILFVGWAETSSFVFNGCLRAASVSGTVMTFGAENNSSIPNNGNKPPVDFSSSAGVFIVLGIPNGTSCSAYAVSITGTAITVGAGLALAGNGYTYSCLQLACGLSSTAVVGYHTTQGRDYLQALSISGTTLTSPASDFSASNSNVVGSVANSTEPRLVHLSSSSYSSGTTSYYVGVYSSAAGCILAPFTFDTSGNVFTIGAKFTFNSNLDYLAYAFSSPSKIFIDIQDSLGYLVCVTPQYSTANTNGSSVIGTALSSASNGAAVSVAVIGGVNPNHSGLTAGATYYAGSDGVVTTSTLTPSIQIGKALSTSKLLITKGI